MGSGDRDAARVPLMAGNWKMFKTSGEGAAFIAELTGRIGSATGREVVVAPPFTGLYEAVRAAEGTCVSVAAQDLFWESDGPYTGEISPAMLADLGVRAVIVGHSERRRLFGESDETTGRKVRAALDGGLVPIMCVGESQEERLAGLTEAVLARQLAAGLTTVRPEEGASVAIAYEPVWAIGTGNTATPETAEEAIAFIRGWVCEAHGEAVANRMRIVYGGSVGPGSIDALMARPGIDGVLVGSASLDVDAFGRIVQFRRT